MSYQRYQMLYDKDGYYKWDIQPDTESRYYLEDAATTKFDRKQGADVLYFINHLFANYSGDIPSLDSYHKMEEMIKFDVPWWKKSHKKVADWLLRNWDRY
jgi:hypothetical protein